MVKKNMKMKETIMSNKRDKLIEFECPECGETMFGWRIIKQPKPFSIWMEFECDKCHHNEEVHLENIVRLSKEG